MDRREASRQLCKMQDEVAGRMGLETQCVCDHAVREPGEVPDAVIEEMWRRLTSSICGKLQYETPSGVTCPEGHGGAPPSGELPKEKRDIQEAIDERYGEEGEDA